jgi:HD-like signal output (HDOD) protein
MKVRSLLTAAEVVQLQQFLDRKLDRIGIQSQPEVAMRLLELSGNPDAQLRDYAEVIRVDHAISGRVLRLANSALFAQVTPVTKLDRACCVLGLERLKAISLGFHLGRAAAGSAGQELSRRIWGQSVLRACLAAEAARLTAPALVAEAFVIGLMIDAGIPLMPALAGPDYAKVIEENRGPGALFRRENESLEFTHVDVVCAMARRWRLPEVLVQPIEWHHTRPVETPRTEPVHRLHRVAYIAGLIEVESGPRDAARAVVNKQSSGVATAQRILGVGDADISRVVTRAVGEYGASIDFFSDIAGGIPDIDTLLDRVQVDLVSALDDGLEKDIRHDQDLAPLRLIIKGQAVAFIRDKDGAMVAYLNDGLGRRLVSHRLEAGAATPQAIAEALGIDLSDTADRERVAALIQPRAA